MSKPHGGESGACWARLSSPSLRSSHLSPAAARHSEYGAAIQFSLLAIVLPALVTVGAPWRLLGLAGNGPSDDVSAHRRPGGRPPASAPRAAVVTCVHRRRPLCRRGMAHTRGGGRRRAAWLAGAAGGRHPSRLRAGPLAGAGDFAPAGPSFGIPASGGAGGLRHVGFLDPRLRRRACPTTTSTGTSTTSPAASAPPRISRSPPPCSGSSPPWPLSRSIFWNALLWLKTDEDPDAELLALARAERAAGHATAERGWRHGLRPPDPASAPARPDRWRGGRPVEGGCRALGSPPPPGSRAASVCRQPCLLRRQAVQRRSVGGVVHQRLDVLDRPAGSPRWSTATRLPRVGRDACRPVSPEPGCSPGHRCSRS